MAKSIVSTVDGGYLIGGTWKGETGDDYYIGSLIKTNSLGEIEWQNYYSPSQGFYYFHIHQFSSGGYIIACTADAGGPCWDPALFRIDDYGNELWFRTFASSTCQSHMCYCDETDDGYLIACGSYQWGDHEPDMYLIKTDLNGNCENGGVPE